jgi:hypothetical protein
MQTKGFASPETKAAFEQARIFVERAEAPGESVEDPLVLFSVLFGFWMANFVAFKADAVRELAAQCLSLGPARRRLSPGDSMRHRRPLAATLRIRATINATILVSGGTTE